MEKIRATSDSKRLDRMSKSDRDAFWNAQLNVYESLA